MQITMNVQYLVPVDDRIEKRNWGATVEADSLEAGVEKLNEQFRNEIPDAFVRSVQTYVK